MTAKDPEADRERRLMQVEGNLKALLDEVQQLRKESAARPNPAAPKM